jgi:hypothetical protein
MFIKNWQRQEIFEKIPYLKKYKTSNTEKTCFTKEIIHNPTHLEYWNFFVDNKKVKYLTEMVKDVSANSLFCLNGDNAIEVAIQLKYPPLIKEVLKTIDLFQLNRLDDDSSNVFDKLFGCDLTSYKLMLDYIKEQNAQSFFSSKHMNILLSCELNKMIYFEKTFPGLFLSLFDNKIDNINPHFQHILLKRDSLFKKLNLKLRKKNNKKQLLKI